MPRFCHIQVATGRRAGSILAAILLLAGCAAGGPATNPVERVATWFDYVAGNDLRRLCGQGAPERWRLVYNAVWHEQVRTYDVVLGAHPTVDVRVFSGGIDLRFGPGGLFPSWIGAAARRPLMPDEAARLRERLAAPLPPAAAPGSFLRSDEFYWTVSRCRDGRFGFAAWRRDMPGFRALPFLEALRPFDESGQAVNPPRPLDLPPLAAAQTQNRGSREAPAFALQVAEDGLRGGPVF